MMDLKLLVFILAIVNSTLLFAQPNAGMPSIPGPCYAKCLISDSYEFWEESYAVYQGKFHDTMDFVERIDISTESQDVRHIYVVTDSSKTDEFVRETFFFKELIEESGYKWKQVICDNKITKDIVKRIHQELYVRGYLSIDEVTEKMDHKNKCALKNFQIDNDLPLGQLDEDTLNSLGLSEFISLK